MNKLEEARRRGYLMSANQEDEDAWYAECGRKNLDCLIVSTRRGGGLRLDCYVESSHAMTDVAYDEVCLLLKRINQNGSRGRSPLRNCSEFSLEFQRDDLDFVLGEAREILLRDRTPARREEIAHRTAPRSGMALVINPEGLWGDHRPDEEVYIQEIANLPGHCLVVKNGHLPLLGLPLSHFRLLAEPDV